MDPLINKWLVLAFAVPLPVAHVIMGLANLDVVTSQWPTLLAMALSMVLVAVICWPTRHNRLPLPLAWSVVTGVVAIEALVGSVLPAGVHPGYAAWQNGAIQMLLVALTFRGRVRLAWLGMALFAVMDFVRSTTHGLSLVDCLALVLTPVMWMVIATAVQIMLGRSRDKIAVFTAQSHESARRVAQEHARSLYRDRWMLDLEQRARPALEAIAQGGLDDGDRRGLALLEAEFRDQVRGRVLASPEVLRAGRAARQRGVKVDLLDDRKSPLPQATLDDALAQLVNILDGASAGAVRARALPVGEHPQVTILAFDESAPEDETYVELP